MRWDNFDGDDHATSVLANTSDETPVDKHSSCISINIDAPINITFDFDKH